MTFLRETVGKTFTSNLDNYTKQNTIPLTLCKSIMAFVLKDDCALTPASAAGKKLFEAKLQFFSPANPPIEE